MVSINSDLLYFVSNLGTFQFSNIGDTYSAILEPARLDHAGVYKMTAENIRGETESVFVVHVIPRTVTPTTLEVSKRPLYAFT